MSEASNSVIVPPVTEAAPDPNRTRWYHLLAYFVAGLFLANSIPHLVNGMSGQPFQSPFASPPGKGLSSSTVNVLWGMYNVMAGYLLVCRLGRSDLRRTSHVFWLGLGALLIGLQLSHHFGELHDGNESTLLFGFDAFPMFADDLSRFFLDGKNLGDARSSGWRSSGDGDGCCCCRRGSDRWSGGRTWGLRLRIRRLRLILSRHGDDRCVRSRGIRRGLCEPICDLIF